MFITYTQKKQSKTLCLYIKINYYFKYSQYFLAFLFVSDYFYINT